MQSYFSTLNDSTYSSLHIVKQGMLLLLLLGSICTSHAAAEPLDSEQQIDFDESILPLISDRCFQCHGPDEAARESGLRLDTREGAFAAGDSGELAIVPGNPTDSAIYQRITSDDPDLVMPPPESGLSLQAEEKIYFDHGSSRAPTGNNTGRSSLQRNPLFPRHIQPGVRIRQSTTSSTEK